MSKSFIKTCLALITTSFIGAALYKKFNGKDNLEYINYTIDHNHIPKAFDGYKIIQISDLHYSSSSNKDLLDSMIHKINQEEPDLIVITGDQIDREGHLIDDCYKYLSQLEGQKYVIMGNHEDTYRYEKSLQAIHKYQLPLLQNQGLHINKEDESIFLCGTKDLTVDTPNIEDSLTGANADDFVIMLSHNPALFNDVDKKRVHLMYSGHNHGGQVNLFGLYAPYLPGPDKSQKYVKGHIQSEGSHLVVSTGIGTTQLHFRFCANPQVTITTLKSTKV